MKIKILRRIVIARNWANTERGERIIVRTLTTISVIGLIDVILLVTGTLYS